MQTPIELGKFLAGVDSNGNLLNYNWLGVECEYTFSNFQTSAGSAVRPRYTQRKVCTVLARNMSGGPLPASDIVQFDVTAEPTMGGTNNVNLLSAGTGTIPLLEHIKKKADAVALPFCGIVDPSLVEAVPDKAIFHVVVQGPAFVRLPNAGLNVSIGNYIISSAEAGHVGLVTLESSETRETLGFALQSRTAANHAGGLLLANITRTFGI